MYCVYLRQSCDGSRAPLQHLQEPVTSVESATVFLETLKLVKFQGGGPSEISLVLKFLKKTMLSW